MICQGKVFARSLLPPIICRWDASVRRGNCSCAVSMTVDMPNGDSRWDQEAACQNTLIASFCSYIGRKSSLTTFCGKGVCCLWVICVYGQSVWSICKPTWPTGCNDWSHSCFPPTSAEHYPAVCDQRRKWKKNPLFLSGENCPGSLEFNLFFFLKARG